jgi:hypothetical protein
MTRISILLSALVVLVLAPQTSPQLATKQFRQDFIVVDSTGKTIGSVIGVSNIGHVTTVAVPFQGKALPVDVIRSSFQQIGLFFLTSDCTGQPFWDASSSPFPTATVSVPGNTLYGQSGAVQSITAASGFDQSGNCFQTSFPLAEAAPMAPAVDLNTFTPPFNVVNVH